MKVKFIVDFMGKETNEQFYPKGSVVDFDPELAEMLVTDGRAVVAEDEVNDQDKPVIKRKRRNT